MICTFFHSEQIHWFAGCYWTNCGPSFPSTVLSITDCLGLTKLSQSLQSQACCRSSISLLLVTLSVGALEQRRASDCFYTSIPNSIPQGYSDGRLNLRIWEKKNVISISIKWRIWDLEKSMSTIQYLPSWSRWLLLMCTLSIISRGSCEQNWNGLTIAHSSSTTRSFSGPSFADFNMHHPPSSESIHQYNHELRPKHKKISFVGSISSLTESGLDCQLL